MAILDLVDCNDPILREVLDPFDLANPPTDPIQLVKDLSETMIHNNGLGLSANQCGLPYNVFVIKAEKIIACFNPKIVDYSDDEWFLPEGCLSYPKLFVKIRRPVSIKARYTEPNGNVVTTQFDGITARVYQHELDHLNGIIYTMRANPYHLDKAKRARKKAIRSGK